MDDKQPILVEKPWAVFTLKKFYAELLELQATMFDVALAGAGVPEEQRNEIAGLREKDGDYYLLFKAEGPEA